MIMSNFISEAERHEELYAVYNKRHQEILSLLNDITGSINNDFKILQSLLQSGVKEDEIDWLKRTGHYLPKVG